MIESEEHEIDYANDIIENAGTLIVLLDLEGRVLRFNKACEKLSGYSFHEIKGKYLWDTLIIPDDIESYRKNTLETLVNNSQNTPLINTHSWMARDNNQYLLEWSHTLLHNTDRKFEGIISIGTDITKRHRAVDALRESEQQFHSLADQAPIMIGTTNETGHITFLNKTWLDFRGKTLEEEEGWAWAAGLHPEDRDRTMAEMESCIEQLLPYSIEYRIEDRNGDYHWLLDKAAPRYDKYGRPCGYIGTATDITDTKKVELALGDSEERYRNIVETSQEGIWTIDAENNTSFVNPKMAEILGYSVAEMQGQSMFYFMDDEGREIAERNVERRKAGIAEQHDFKFLRKDGNEVWAELNANPLFDREGNYIGSLAMITDITERKKAEDNLQEALLLNTRIIEETPIGLAIYDHTGQCIVANESVAQMIGASREQMLKQNYHNILAWKECGLYAEVQMAIESNTSRAFESAIDTSFGKSLQLHYQIVPFLSRGQKHLLLMAADITEQRHFEETTIKLTERLKLATESAHIGIWDWDIEKNELIWDDRMFELYGVKKDHFSGAYEAWLAGLHPADREFAKEAVNQAINKDKPYDIEFRICLPDGTIRHIKGIGQVFWDQHDRPLRMLGVNYDITARNQTAAALQESEALLEKAQELTHIGHWKLNTKTNEITGSDELFRIFGLTKDEATLDAFVDVVHPDDKDRDVAAIQRGAEYGESWDIEHRLICRNGTQKWVHALGEAIIDEDGKVIELIGTVQDISDYKQTQLELDHHRTHLEELVKTRTIELEQKILEHTRAEAALRESEHRLHAIMDTAAEGIITINHTGIVESFNTSAEKLFGYSHDEVIGNNISMLMFKEDARQHDNHIKRYLQTGIARMIGTAREVEGKHKNGTPIQLELSISESKQGDQSIFTGILHDIAERKQQENALRQATIDAEKANKSKSDFLASMSHELRTPMNAILGFGQLLADDPENPLTASQQECIDQIMEGGEHLLDLINDILDLARIEAGKVNFSIEPLQLKPLLDKCLSLVSTLAQDRNIKLIRKYEDIDYIVSADYTRTQQVILNLLSNSIKYNRERGTVTIDCKETTTGMLRISITDTGHGIPLNKQDEIFQPFNRLGVETSNIEGTGIGLTVSKTLVELMDGQIGFDSEFEKGSTFWIELQLINEHALKNPTSNELLIENTLSTAIPNLSGTLLYVEDNPANLKLMKSIVNRIDRLSMISAINAKDGIEIARTKQPDIIILDINLPDMNGFEALDMLKNYEETSRIPVLALSASASQQDIDKGLDAGFQHYLTKPLQIQNFIETLKKAMTEKTI